MWLLHALPPWISHGGPRTDLRHPGHSNIVSVADIGADEFVDADADNVADHWEILCFAAITNTDGTADADTDQLNDRGEYEQATDPHDGDTDNDGWTDGAEVLSYGTDPRNSDTDGDGIIDGDEGLCGTDPTNSSSVFAVFEPPAGTPTQFELAWPSVSGRCYAVDRSTNLLSGFVALTSNLVATPQTNSFLDSSVPGPGPYLYRVHVALDDDGDGIPNYADPE